MAGSKDLAEQAFSLLTDALRSSEERIAELDAELKRKRSPKNRLEEQTDVLSHRLETVEAECEKWRREVGQLEELLVNERAKIAQLKKKLEVAESGPDKLSKKEVNYWRQRAEKFDADTRQYKRRIAKLRQELRAQSRELDKVSAANLQSDIKTSASLDAANAEIEALRNEIAARDRDLAPLREALEQAQATVRSLQETLQERESRIASASAEIEKTRQALSRREERAREAAAEAARTTEALTRRSEAAETAVERLQAAEAEASEQRAALGSQLDAAQATIDSLHREIESQRNRADGLDSELGAARTHADSIRSELEAAMARTESLERERDEARDGAAARDREHDEARGQIESLRHELAEAQAHADSLQNEHRDAGDRVDTLQRELDDARAHAGTLQAELDDARARADTFQAELDGARRQAESAQQTLAEREREWTEADEERHASLERIASLETTLDDLRNQLDGKHADLDRTRSQLVELRDTRPALEAELAELREKSQSLEKQLTQSHGQANAATDEQARVIETLNNLLSQRDTKIAEAEQSALSLQAENDALTRRIAELEANLAEERECMINVNEIANERAEEIEKLVEKLEEAEERYEEAKWRLGKAAHYERLVVKRKVLIRSLIEAYRAKMKANTALKAGIDGLRTFKATSEKNQQKLMARAEKLARDLKEARAMLTQQQSETVARSSYEEIEERAADLERRVSTQIDLIQSLEVELHEARAAHSAQDEAAAQDEIDRLREEGDALREEIARKNSAIEVLEADADEQQKKIAKLRGSESETARLKALKHEDQDKISALEAEISTLKSQLARAASQAQAVPPDAAGIVREKDKQIGRLEQELKEQSKEIDSLKEAVSAWQKKYEFISTEAPSAYQSAT